MYITIRAPVARRSLPAPPLGGGHPHILVNAVRVDRVSSWSGRCMLWPPPRECGGGLARTPQPSRGRGAAVGNGRLCAHACHHAAVATAGGDGCRGATQGTAGCREWGQTVEQKKEPRLGEARRMPFRCCRQCRRRRIQSREHPSVRGCNPGRARPTHSSGVTPSTPAAQSGDAPPLPFTIQKKNTLHSKKNKKHRGSTAFLVHSGLERLSRHPLLGDDLHIHSPSRDTVPIQGGHQALAERLE